MFMLLLVLLLLLLLFLLLLLLLSLLLLLLLLMLLLLLLLLLMLLLLLLLLLLCVVQGVLICCLYILESLDESYLYAHIQKSDPDPAQLRRCPPVCSKMSYSGVPHNEVSFGKNSRLHSQNSAVKTPMWLNADHIFMLFSAPPPHNGYFVSQRSQPVRS